MSRATKSKSWRQNAARPTRGATRSEDDAEQALKEIVAVQTKPADRRDSATVLREKQTKRSR